ncbi:MAG: electron transfer flavoprotein subunit alpha/FixB family protein [Ignavibacteria bacterium]|nr:electron transfer flavoprotein subunit alpha/FixB family protein [Ignavibacteria bacterium]
MNILVYLEQNQSGLRRSSLEALTAARLLNANKVVGLLINGSAENVTSAGQHGANIVLTVTNDSLANFQNSVVANVVAQAAKHAECTNVFFSANATGKDLAPRVAVLLEAGLLADCVKLELVSGTIQAVRPVYAGKANAKVRCTTQNTVATLRPNVFTAQKVDGGIASSESYSPEIPSVRSATVSNIVRNEGSIDVAEADIVVSGGRGLRGPENFHLIEELAKSLGGAVGASRAVVDAGWRPHREQVGQTGKTVSPNMYVACAISGAVQHLAGMSSSKVIVAINKDKDAPIFKIADYGIVGDVFEVLPKLTLKISEVVGK